MRFSLRDLFGLFVVVALALAWRANVRQLVRQMNEAHLEAKSWQNKAENLEATMRAAGLYPQGEKTEAEFADELVPEAFD